MRPAEATSSTSILAAASSAAATSRRGAAPAPPRAPPPAEARRRRAAPPADVWDTGGGRGRSWGEQPLSEWVFSRWRETEVHHADLGLEFGWPEWSPAYVREDLRRATMAWRARQPMGQGDLPPLAL